MRLVILVTYILWLVHKLRMSVTPPGRDDTQRQHGLKTVKLKQHPVTQSAWAEEQNHEHKPSFATCSALSTRPPKIWTQVTGKQIESPVHAGWGFNSEIMLLLVFYASFQDNSYNNNIFVTACGGTGPRFPKVCKAGRKIHLKFWSFYNLTEGLLKKTGPAQCLL